MMNIKALHQLVAIAVVSVVAAQQLEFTNFPKNLNLHINQPLALTWRGQGNYVNITLAQFYYYGGGSEFRGAITTFNTGSSTTWTPGNSLEQGIYGFFIATPNRNSSESPFFTFVSANTTSALSDAAKVGIGLGIPLGLTIVACAIFILWRERSRRIAMKRAISSPRSKVDRPVENVVSLELP